MIHTSKNDLITAINLALIQKIVFIIAIGIVTAIVQRILRLLKETCSTTQHRAMTH